MSSLSRLNEEATNLTAAVNGTQVRPPAVAAVNPLLELLLASVRSYLPDVFLQRMTSVSDPAEFLDWFGVALLWRALPPDAGRQQLIAEAGHKPSEVALTWARIVAPHVPQLRPTPRQRACDLIGLALGFALLMVLLLLRCGLCYVVNPPGARIMSAWLLGALVYLPLAEVPRQLWWLLAATALCAADLIAPVWMERLRIYVFHAVNQTPINAERTDGLYVAWRLHTLILTGVFVWRLWR
jgi:hypothetical protein